MKLEARTRKSTGTVEALLAAFILPVAGVYPVVNQLSASPLLPAPGRKGDNAAYTVVVTCFCIECAFMMAHTVYRPCKKRPKTSGFYT